MAHLIEKSSHFAYRGETPWHELGIYGDVITPDFLRTHTEFCHTVYKKPYLFPDGANATKAFYLETDEGHIINDLVGDRYTVLQCDDILAIAEPLMSLYDVETAGRLAWGRKVFIVFKLKNGIKVGNNDAIDNYVVLMDSRDGSAPRLYLTPIRVVCNNTLQMSLRDIRTESKPLRHTANIKGRIDDAVIEMGLLEEQLPMVEHVFSQMLSREVNMVQMVGDLFLSADNYRQLMEKEELSTRSANILRDVLGVYSDGVGQVADGSAWMAYNGITNYFSHKPYKEKGYDSAEARRMDGVLWGTEANMMKKAFEYCLVPQQVNREFVSKLENALFNS